MTTPDQHTNPHQRSRVGDGGQAGKQVRGFAVVEGLGVGEWGQGGGDRG
jgi:hypothetical protein